MCIQAAVAEKASSNVPKVEEKGDTVAMLAMVQEYIMARCVWWWGGGKGDGGHGGLSVRYDVGYA